MYGRLSSEPRLVGQQDAPGRHVTEGGESRTVACVDDVASVTLLPCLDPSAFSVK